jgi:hypothetical protein
VVAPVAGCGLYREQAFQNSFWIFREVVTVKAFFNKQ